jgi:hypothetical protein
MTSFVRARELRPSEMCKVKCCGKERSPRTNPRTSQCHQLQQSSLNMSYQLETLQFLIYHKSKRDLAINQVPITTNPLLPKYYIDSHLLAVTLIAKEESPHKPETTLLCVRSRSKNVIALIIAPKE